MKKNTTLIFSPLSHKHTPNHTQSTVQFYLCNRPAMETEEMQKTQEIRCFFARAINAYFQAEHPGFQCCETLSGIICGEKQNLDRGFCFDDPSCIVQFETEKYGILFPQWRITKLIMGLNIYCQNKKFITILRLRSLWDIFFDAEDKKYVDNMKYVDTLTEEECLQHIFESLEDHVLPAAPPHGLK